MRLRERRDNGATMGNGGAEAPREGGNGPSMKTGKLHPGIRLRACCDTQISHILFVLAANMPSLQTMGLREIAIPPQKTQTSGIKPISENDTTSRHSLQYGADIAPGCRPSTFIIGDFSLEVQVRRTGRSFRALLGYTKEQAERLEELVSKVRKH